MIELNNNGNAVTINDSPDGKYKIISINESLTLKARKVFSIPTELVVKCTSDLDECWIWSDPIFDKDGEELPFSSHTGMVTKRVTKKDGEYNVTLMGGYMGSKDVEIPAGAEIARIYFSAPNFKQADLKELSFNTLYETPEIIVKSSPDFSAEYEIVIDPNGDKYLRIYMPPNM